MLPARSHLSVPRTNFRPVLLSIAFLLVATFALSNPAHAQQSTEVFPLSQVQPGMQGYAYTIFAGDQVEKFDLEVIGVMPNFLGPRNPSSWCNSKAQKSNTPAWSPA